MRHPSGAIHARPGFIVSLRYLARAGFLVAGLAYGLGLLGSKWWLFDLLAHFRVQYGWTAAASAITLLFMRDMRWALPACLVGAVLIGPVLLETAQHAAPADARAGARPVFKLLTLNAWFRNHDTARVAQYLERSGADVILVQELDAARMQELISALPTYSHAALDASVDRHGAAILSRWPIEDARPLLLAPNRGQAQWTRIRWHDVDVQVVAVHLPWPLGPNVSNERNVQLQALANWMRAAEGPVIVGGDFNLTAWSTLFRKAVQTANAQPCAAQRRALSTWPTFFPPLGIQIDHCWVSQHWRVVDVNRGPTVGSDHYPMAFGLQLQDSALIPLESGA